MKPHRLYLKLFVHTSFVMGLYTAAYIAAVMDPIFHLKYNTVIRTLACFGGGIIFGLVMVAHLWLLRRKFPNMLSYSPWQKRTILVNGSIAQAHALSKRALTEMKVRELKFDGDYKLVAKTARSIFKDPFGEKIELRFRPLGDTQTEIEISSAPLVIKPIADGGAGWINVDTIANTFVKTNRAS